MLKRGIFKGCILILTSDAYSTRSPEGTLKSQTTSIRNIRATPLQHSIITFPKSSFSLIHTRQRPIHHNGSTKKRNDLLLHHVFHSIPQKTFFNMTTYFFLSLFEPKCLIKEKFHLKAYQFKLFRYDK